MAEIREEIAEILRHSSYGYAATAPVNKLLALFQKEQLQLVTELLEKRGNPADYVGVQSVVPKSVLAHKKQELEGTK